MESTDVEALQQRVLELQDQVISLQGQVVSLERRTDTIFCKDCSNKCNRNKITCDLCLTIKQPEREFSDDGITRQALTKVFICAPSKGDGSTTAREANWAKIRSYASMAYREGYMPFAPKLYFTLFIDNTNADDVKEARGHEIAWLEEVYLAGGEFWVCNDPTGHKEMREEILIAESLNMKIKYAFDHPLAEREPVARPVPSVEDQTEEFEERFPEEEEPPAPPQATLTLASEQKVKTKGNPVDWALRKIATSPDIDSVKKVKNWAAKNVPKEHLGRINFVVGEKIKELNAA